MVLWGEQSQWPQRRQRDSSLRGVEEGKTVLTFREFLTLNEEDELGLILYSYVYINILYIYNKMEYEMYKY